MEPTDGAVVWITWVEVFFSFYFRNSSRCFVISFFVFSFHFLVCYFHLPGIAPDFVLFLVVFFSFQLNSNAIAFFFLVQFNDDIAVAAIATSTTLTIDWEFVFGYGLNLKIPGPMPMLIRLYFQFSSGVKCSSVDVVYTDNDADDEIYFLLRGWMDSSCCMHTFDLQIFRRKHIFLFEFFFSARCLSLSLSLRQIKFNSIQFNLKKCLSLALFARVSFERR